MSIDDYEDITFRDVPRLINRAKAVDHHAAMRLIELLWVAAKGNTNAPVELIDYFGECIDGLREARKAPEITKALNLTKPRHRAPEPDKWLREGVLAIAVEDMRKQGETLEDAIEKVAKEYRVSESTVKKAYLSSELLKR